jgi:hypothetical protein
LPDPQGNLLIPDGVSYNDGAPGFGDNLVRVVAARTGTFYGQPMKAGRVYTIAGTGLAGPRGDAGPATRATVLPWAITAAPDGNVVLSDNRSTIRVVAESSGRFYGKQLKAGDIYTIAGGGTSGPPVHHRRRRQPSSAVR